MDSNQALYSDFPRWTHRGGLIFYATLCIPLACFQERDNLLVQLLLWLLLSWLPSRRSQLSCICLERFWVRRGTLFQRRRDIFSLQLARGHGPPILQHFILLRGSTPQVTTMYNFPEVQECSHVNGLIENHESSNE